MRVIAYLPDIAMAMVSPQRVTQPPTTQSVRADVPSMPGPRHHRYCHAQHFPADWGEQATLMMSATWTRRSEKVFCPWSPPLPRTRPDPDQSLPFRRDRAGQLHLPVEANWLTPTRRAYKGAPIRLPFSSFAPRLAEPNCGNLLAKFGLSLPRRSSA